MAPGVMWTKEVNEALDCDKLNQLVERHGKKWTPIASVLGAGRTGKQCRRQWERLNIMTKQCGWAPEEDALLLEYHARYGNKWTRISRLIGGRTDNAVKNRYHALKLKRKTKYLTRSEPTHSGDSASGKRSLQKNNSLEERRAAKEQERLKTEEGLYPEEGVAYKSEAIYKTGYYGNFDEGWNGGYTSKSAWMDVSKITSSPYGFSSSNTGVSQPYLMNMPSMPLRTIVASSMDDGHKLAEDADSMESSSENKHLTTTAQSDCITPLSNNPERLLLGLSSMMEVPSNGRTPFFLGTSTHPLPSRVLNNGQQLEMMNYVGNTIPEPTVPKMAPELTLDLSFLHKADAFDFDSFLHSVSPASPGACAKFLNTLNPFNHQPSCVSDHDSMKA